MKSQIFKLVALIALLMAGGFSSTAQNNRTAQASFAIDKNIISVEIPNLVDIHIFEYEPYSGYGGFPEAWSPHEWTIRMIMDEGTDVTSLAPIISLAPGATITSQHASVQDFSQPVVYTVICEDGSTVTYCFSAYIKDNTRAIGTIYIDCLPSNAGYTKPSSYVFDYDDDYPFSCTATPYTGYSFKRWLVNNSPAGINPKFDDYIHLNQSGFVNLRAEFVSNVQYTVSVVSADPTKGYVSGGGNVSSGSGVTVSATPYS